MKTLLITALMALTISTTVQAQACPNLSGNYVADGEHLKIEQRDCSYIKYIIGDDFLVNELVTEYFPNQGEYRDPNYSSRSNAVRVDSFEGNKFVSHLRFKVVAKLGNGQTSESEEKFKRVEISLDPQGRVLTMDTYELASGSWARLYHWTWVRQQ